MDVDLVADELYGLLPSEFTPVRNARAADARREGDRAAAAAIMGLRRPTVGAWLANLVVRRHRDQVGELLELGTAMRRAHAELAGPELRRLAERRHQLIADIGTEARRLAEDAAQPISEGHLAELEATLEAASAEPEAALALGAGHLTAALHYSGLGPVEPTSASAATTGRSTRRQAPAETEQAPRPRRRPAGEPDRGPPRAGERGATREHEVRAKQASLEEANQELDRSQATVVGLEAELEDLRTKQAAARRRLEEAKRARGAAERRQRAAAADLERARAAPEDGAARHRGLTPKTPPQDAQ